MFCIPWRDAKILAHRPRKLRHGAAVGYMYNVKGTEHTGQRQVLSEADAEVQLERFTTRRAMSTEVKEEYD